MILISKAGKYCYVKNALLREERNSQKPSPSPHKHVHSSSKHPSPNSSSQSSLSNRIIRRSSFLEPSEAEEVFGPEPPAIRKLEEQRRAEQERIAEARRLELLESARETRVVLTYLILG